MTPTAATAVLPQALQRPGKSGTADSSIFAGSRLGGLEFRGNRQVDFPILVAPMVGISHVAFRALVRSYLPAGASTLLFTEMLSSRRLPSERVGDTPLTYV